MFITARERNPDFSPSRQVSWRCAWAHREHRGPGLWCRDCAPLAFAALILSEVFALPTLAQDDTGDASAALILS
jgi:hypothetical protein